MGEFIAGLDLGQASDYSALTIVEKLSPSAEPNPYGDDGAETYVNAPWDNAFNQFSRAVEIDREPIAAAYHLRHIERYKLKTPYPTICRQVRDLLRRPPLLGNAQLVVDATGVGRAVVDELDALNVDHARVTITGGNEVHHVGRDYSVPKRDLVGVLQVAFQSNRLKIAASLPHAQTLTAELLSFRAKIGVGGHDTYESWREQDHDDLVLSVALAVWYAEAGRGSVWFL